MGLCPGPAFIDTRVKLGAVMARSADISLHDAEGEGFWILLPAGSTSFPVNRSLNAVSDFKDI